MHTELKPTVQTGRCCGSGSALGMHTRLLGLWVWACPIGHGCCALKHVSHDCCCPLLATPACLQVRDQLMDWLCEREMAVYQVRPSGDYVQWLC